MKIGILTLPFDPNYGYILQTYALQKVLSQMGHEAVILNRCWNQSNNTFTYKAKRWLYYNVICRRIYLRYSKIPHSPLFRSSQILREYVVKERFDAIVVGSDQIWRIENTRGAELNFFLDFLEGIENIKRIAYAASFGNETWAGSEEETKRISMLLSNFNGISVREMSGVRMCKEYFKANAECVLDPTLLIGPTGYDELSKGKFVQNQLVTYILDETEDKLQFINKVAKKKKLTVKSLYHKTNYYYESVESWVHSIKNASFVIVDSYHGMIFSIIFNKQFIVIANKKRGDTRFVNLLEMIGLRNRLIEDLNEQSILQSANYIDYTIVNPLIKKEQERSLALLKTYIS